MGEALLIKKAASSNSTPFAIITAIYPSGSTCTCTNGTITFIAPNTNGQVIFNIPEIGTWTVTTTNGTNTKSQSVSIAEEGQSETITLSYEFAILTETDGLASGYSVSGKAVKPAIDITNYTTMTVVAKVTWRAASGYGVYFGVSTSASSTADFPAEVNITSTSNKTYNIDISELTGSYYIRAYDSMEFSEGTISVEKSGAASIEIYSIKFT